MKTTHRIQIQMSEAREKLNGMMEIRSDDSAQLAERQAITDKLAQLEGEYRAAVEVEGSAVAGQTVETAEWRNLNDRFDLGEMFGNVLEHRVATGAIAEIQQERGLAPNAMPVETLMEYRAVTPAPSEVGQVQNQVEGFVFPRSAAAFLGIPSPVVGVGDTVFPVLTSDPAAGTPAENAKQAETTGAFSADALVPSRIQASFFWSREDAARFAGMGDALREALQGGLADKLDQQIMGGTNGLLTGMILANNNVSAVTGFSDYISDLAMARVDGQYAAELSDIRIVMGSGTYAHAGGIYRATESDRTALDRLAELTAGVRVSKHVPAVSNANKQNAVIRLGMRRDMVAPVWGNITLIPDEVTKAGAGQVVLTAVLLHAVKLLRSGGFHKQQTQHA